MPGVNLVLDTNVYVTYARYGRLQNLVQTLFHHDLNFLVDGTLLAEIDDVLRRPGVLKDETLSVDDVVSFIQEFTIHVVARSSFVLSPDPEDNFLFDIALQHRAPVIVTDEKALLGFTASPVAVRSLKWFKENFPRETK